MIAQQFVIFFGEVKLPDWVPLIAAILDDPFGEVAEKNSRHVRAVSLCFAHV
jgi:hypothetical protein